MKKNKIILITYLLLLIFLNLYIYFIKDSQVQLGFALLLIFMIFPIISIVSCIFMDITKYSKFFPLFCFFSELITILNNFSFSNIIYFNKDIFENDWISTISDALPLSIFVLATCSTVILFKTLKKSKK